MSPPHPRRRRPRAGGAVRRGRRARRGAARRERWRSPVRAGRSVLAALRPAVRPGAGRGGARRRRGAGPGGRARGAPEPALRSRCGPRAGCPAGGAVGPSPHLVGLRARAIAALGRPGRIVVAGAPALIERVPGRRRRRASRSPSRSAGGRIRGRCSTAWPPSATSACPRSRSGARSRCAGGLVDVYPSTADAPVRIDLFGDEVESIRAFSPFTQRSIRSLERVALWPAAEPADVPHADPLVRSAAGPGRGRAPGSVRARRGAPARPLERLEDEAAAGELADAEPTLARLAEAAALDLVPPGGGRAPVFDAAEPRFAVRGMREAEAELARLARGGRRVIVAFDRRGDLERTAHQLERTRATVLGPDDPPPAPGEPGLRPHAAARRGALPGPGARPRPRGGHLPPPPAPGGARAGRGPPPVELPGPQGRATTSCTRTTASAGCWASRPAPSPG